jgi:hypothetical protein
MQISQPRQHQNVLKSSEKLRDIVTDINQIWICDTDFQRVHIIKVHENPLVEAELIHADRQTDEQMERHYIANKSFLRVFERASKVTEIFVLRLWEVVRTCSTVRDMCHMLHQVKNGIS